MKLKFIAALALTGALFAGRVSAQTTPAEQQFTPSHLKAAENLLLAIGVDKLLDKSMNTMLSAVSKNLPSNQQAAFMSAMHTFMNKYVTWDKLKESYEKIYASELSEADLNSLAAFFNTPVGQAYTTKVPELLQKTVALGQNVVMNHQAELQQMMEDEMKKTDSPSVKEKQ